MFCQLTAGRSVNHTIPPCVTVLFISRYYNFFATVIKKILFQSSPKPCIFAKGASSAPRVTFLCPGAETKCLFCQAFLFLYILYPCMAPANCLSCKKEQLQLNELNHTQPVKHSCSAQSPEIPLK